MSPRRVVIVENRALRRFKNKYGFCVNAAWLAGVVETEVLRTEVQGDIECAGMHVVIKKRNVQYFVTDIDMMEE